MSGKKPNGIVLVPYLLKIASTSVNGETVWHSNPLINVFLKWDKFSLIFINRNNYLYKQVNSKYYISDFN